MKEILVVNRVHPDEHFIGDQVDDLFRAHPINGVRLITREVPEDAREQRGLAPGSNTIFRTANPTGDPDEQFIYEIKEAAQQARAVIDIHGHKREGGAGYPFYGEVARENPLALGIASLLASDGVVVHSPTSPHLAAGLSNYVGWDLNPHTDVSAFRPALERLGAGWLPPVRPMEEYQHFSDVTAADGARCGFDEEYELFEPLPADALIKLGLPLECRAGGWSASLYGRIGMWGEVLIPRLEIPI